ncbi:MAG: ABC transporter ATP-binding protein [Armatimonadetes bacterium]|nr:ABC transporter ATP-binding protein [Armatimonadota bacterium]
MGGLTLDNVTMAYGPRVLFAGVCAQAGPGETLVVTGANGAGKSTLLKIIAGLVRPEEGRVRREGAFGYAAPDVHLYAELTGRENLAFFAGLRGLADDPDALLARVGLPRGRGGDLVGAYSSGMRQRLKLAVSLLGEPPLLIWDEPTLALDAAGGERVEEILGRHRRGGGVAVLAANDPVEADRWAAGGVRLHIGAA